MANSITPYAPEYWSNIMAAILRKRTIWRNICAFTEEATLRDGDIVHRPYRTALVAGTYTKGTALTAVDLAATDDYLTVNQHNAVYFYIDDIDNIQNKKGAEVANAYIKDASVALAIREDAFALFEVYNAVNDISDDDITSGGTDGVAVTLTTSNVDKVFAVAAKKLYENNVEIGDWFAVISPATYQILLERVGARASEFGDNTMEFGRIGEGTYYGFKLYLSNNLTFSARFTPTDNPSNAETITINGITCKFVTSLSGTATAIPEFHIASDTANTIKNLVTAFNANRTAIAESTNAGYQLPTEASMKEMDNWFAVDGTTYFDVYVKGGGDVTVAASSTDVGAWTRERQHHFFGKKGCVDAVVQKNPNVKSQEATSAGLIGTRYIAWDMFGIKTFNKGTYEMVNVKIAS